jgi:hypothetical protein
MILTLFLYVKPQGAAWPLTASILDPVRLCLVASGPARIVEIARWFTNQKQVFDLLLHAKDAHNLLPSMLIINHAQPYVHCGTQQYYSHARTRIERRNTIAFTVMLVCLRVCVTEWCCPACCAAEEQVRNVG